MNRVNVYAFPHKGLRNALSQVSLLAGNTDYTNPEDLNNLKKLTSELIELLELHSHSEDNFVLPALEAKVPGSTHENAEDHEQLEKQVAALAKTIQELNIGANLEAGARFYAAVSDFQAKYLLHMALEESDLLDLIWTNFTDPELLEMHGEIMQTFTPEQVMKWFRFIVPALNPIERYNLLAGFKANAPDFFYHAVIKMLATVMPDKDLVKLEHMLHKHTALQST